MSHHFDAPTGREDPRLNLCDLCLFQGPWQDGHGDDRQPRGHSPHGGTVVPG